MKSISIFCLATTLLTSSSLWAAESTAVASATTTNAVATKTLPYGDNPSLGRVLLYKTGKGIENLGNSIEGASANTSEKLSKAWQSTKEYTAEQTDVAKEKTEKAKAYTAKKWQDSKDAVVGVNDGSIPIEQVPLSQSSSQN